MKRKSRLTSGMFSSTTDLWATPQEFFDELNKEFDFTLDPCATAENAKCPKFYTEKDNGLTKSWQGERVFCNPPYGRAIADWVKKCHDEAEKGALVVMLIPARTDTSYFHDYIYHKADIRFIRGRLHFNGAKQGAPFPSMVVVYSAMKSYIVQINFKGKSQPWREHIFACDEFDAFAQADKIFEDWKRNDPNTSSVIISEDK